MSIAIVGLACCYPDAKNPTELWENVLAQRRAFRRLPQERLNLADYFSPDPSVPDAVYTQEAAVIEGYQFDRSKFRIAGSVFRSADLAHWLALDVASQALVDAGLPEGEGLPKETTGVLLGNTLTGEFSRAQVLRLRWPYVRRVVAERLVAAGWEETQRREFLQALEKRYKAPFEPVGEETLAGGLSNTIAGRICNQFRFHGGGYTLDGACSSSLLAVAQACLALETRELDAALVGGVDLSLDPFELVGFAKTGALARDGIMRVYDRNSCGFLPGEGCGFALLLREQDARALGLRIYAFICGFGLSSDGGGGITRPELSGQKLALERAYRRAGYSIASIALIEGHGTGTSVGDQVELATLIELLHSAGAKEPVAIGSIKANIGHTKAAAGIAGLIKAALALHHQILPPTTGVTSPHPLLADSPLRVLEQGELWPKTRPLRAGVSAFGFGGINVHVTLEASVSVRRQNLSKGERRLLASLQDAELFLLAAQGLPELIAQVERLSALQLAHAELADLAACLAQRLIRGQLRASLVASTPKELAERLALLHSWLKEGESERLDLEAGVFLGSRKSPPRIAFLFPGQASPVRITAGIWGRRFGRVHKLYASADLTESTIQPAIVLAELAGLEVLKSFKLEAHLSLGHSLGELTALYWAGAMDAQTLLRLVQVREKAMAEAPGSGAMASLALEVTQARAFIESEEIAIACLNAPDQTVISGPADQVARVIALAKARGIAATQLPVAHAFHSPLMRPAAKRLAEQLCRERFRPVSRRVLSTVTGTWIDQEEDLRALLVQQLTSPVRFTEVLAQAAQAADLLLEVGPGQVLTRLVQANCQLPAISLDCSGSSLRGLLAGLGAAYALGTPIDPQRLFADRLVRAFDLERQPQFFQNPCELAPCSELALEAVRTIQAPAVEVAHPPVSEIKALEVIRQLVAHKAELPLSAVKDDHHLLSDLHLNSISIGQIVVEAARRLGLPPPLAPTEYAGATVAQAAQALECLRECGPSAAETVPSGVDSWVRAFTVELVEQALTLIEKAPPGKGSWQVFAPRGHRLAAILAEQLRVWGGVGVLVWLPPQLDEEACNLLLSAAHAALEHDGSERYFVLVQHHGVAAAFARTLYLETKALSVRVVDVPPIEPACDWVLAEVQAAEDYIEAYYDTQGKRWINALRLLAIEEATKMPLGRENVVLISGGGKGIAAECGLALAKESGAKLVLLGRSEPERDPVLAANLARFAAAGIGFCYYAADVADEAAVRQAIAKACAKLGPVTAILHGAGVNYPQPLAKLDLKTLSRTLAPKQQGLKNLLAAVDPSKLGLLVTFSSIIGRFGLPGEADYALANAELSRLTEEFQAKHPACRCLALEWSIWSGVGMGERLGRVDALLRQGISPITVEEGILWLRRLLGASTPVRVLVSGRLGSQPPFPILPQLELPFYRFLENPRLFYPRIELIVDAEISPASDFYLDDHVWQGERLLPAVLGLEAMAQAACAVIGKAEAPAFQEIEFLHPIVVSDSGITLRIAALVRHPDTVEVVLRSSQTGFQLEHFRAVCRFGLALSQERELSNVGVGKIRLDLDPERDLYADLLFQRGRFKRLRGYLELSAFSCQAEIAEKESIPWFSQYLSQELLLGDPGVRDAALHAVQACIPHALVLPVGLDRWLPGDLRAPGPWIVQAQERWQQGDIFCYDLAIYSTTGVLRERLEGLRLKRMSSISRASWPLSLLVPYLQRQVRDLTGAVVRLGLEQAANEQALQRILSKEENLFRRPDGKPVSLGTKKVAISHRGNLTLIVVSANSVACDLEIIAKRPWGELLGERYALAELIARELEEDFDTAATRVWTAQECLKKAGRAWDTPLALKAVAQDRWIILTAGTCSIASWWGNREDSTPLALAVLTAFS